MQKHSQFHTLLLRPIAEGSWAEGSGAVARRQTCKRGPNPCTCPYICSVCTLLGLFVASRPLNSLIVEVKVCPCAGNDTFLVSHHSSYHSFLTLFHILPLFHPFHTWKYLKFRVFKVSSFASVYEGDSEIIVYKFNNK